MGFDTVAIVGVGLIGGSVGMGVRRRKLARRVVGIGYRQASLDRALQAGAVDQITTDLARGVAEAELILFATPVDLTVQMVRLARRSCPPEAVLTDVGGTKARIVEQLDADGPVFVGGHPLAGREKRGVEAARENLFEGAACVLTPTGRTPAAALSAVQGLWESLGAEVLRMDADAHDRALAAVSHLPHLVSAALVSAVAEPDRKLAASGFLSATRIAAGDPRVWQAIFRHNREAVLAALATFENELAAFREALSTEDADRMEQLLANAKGIRDAMAS